jgi:type II secretory pathway component PulL
MSKKITPQINFLKQRQRQVAVWRKQDGLIFNISVAVLVIVVLVAIALASWLYYQKKQETELLRQERNLETELLALSDQEAKYLVFFSRLEMLAEIWPNRQSHQETLRLLSDILLPGLEFKQVKYQKTDGSLQYNVSASDFFVFEEFINLMRNSDFKERFNNLSFSDIRRDKDGSYNFTVTMSLKENT